MCAKENVATVSKESLAALDDVRRGKPRRFVMVCKGPQIVSLVVFKKGIVEQRKKEAKQEGTGTVFWGVATGPAPDITFQLASSDGFDSAPTRSTVLKDFLEEAADLKCKPLFQVVAATPIVLDDDSPLVQRLESLRYRYEEALSRQLGDTGQMRSLWDYANEKCDAGLLPQATKALDGLEKLLATALADGVKETDVIPEGIVAAMRQRLDRARIRWDEGLHAAAFELRKVQAGIQDTDPELAKALTPVLTGYRNELHQILQQVSAAKQAQDLEKLIRAAREATQRLQQETAQDSLLALLDTYGEAEVKLQPVFAQTLIEVQQHLEAI